MSLPKIEDLKNLSSNDLENEIASVKKQLFQLRLYRGTRQPFKPHQFIHLKHRLGQLLMIQKSNKKVLMKNITE
uniref:50S ribosomal protein L29 n=1 Tax=Phaeostrophion irregulare TaxID=243268 RepID=UPI002E78A5CD|nr:50S ribosomal protein L29 [Phaeostrophion irregulare]WAM64275.1 50S ribosomal protein L29 [Phaeostrophion irregulare]